MFSLWIFDHWVDQPWMIPFKYLFCLFLLWPQLKQIVFKDKLAHWTSAVKHHLTGDLRILKKVKMWVLLFWVYCSVFYVSASSGCSSNTHGSKHLKSCAPIFVLLCQISITKQLLFLPSASTKNQSAHETRSNPNIGRRLFVQRENVESHKTQRAQPGSSLGLQQHGVVDNIRHVWTSLDFSNLCEIGFQSYNGDQVPFMCWYEDGTAATQRDTSVMKWKGL